jgi:hypothetical protein
VSKARLSFIECERLSNTYICIKKVIKQAQFKRDEFIIPTVVVVRGTIERDLQSSDTTEQEIDEQDDWLLWHD